MLGLQWVALSLFALTLNGAAGAVGWWLLGAGAGLLGASFLVSLRLNGRPAPRGERRAALAGTEIVAVEPADAGALLHA